MKYNSLGRIIAFFAFFLIGRATANNSTSTVLVTFTTWTTLSIGTIISTEETCDATVTIGGGFMATETVTTITITRNSTHSTPTLAPRDIFTSYITTSTGTITVPLTTFVKPWTCTIYEIGDAEKVSVTQFVDPPIQQQQQPQKVTTSTETDYYGTTTLLPGHCDVTITSTSTAIVPAETVYITSTLPPGVKMFLRSPSPLTIYPREMEERDMDIKTITEPATTDTEHSTCTTVLVMSITQQKITVVGFVTPDAVVPATVAKVTSAPTSTSTMSSSSSSLSPSSSSSSSSESKSNPAANPSPDVKPNPDVNPGPKSTPSTDSSSSLSTLTPPTPTIPAPHPVTTAVLGTLPPSTEKGALETPSSISSSISSSLPTWSPSLESNPDLIYLSSSPSLPSSILISSSTPEGSVPTGNPFSDSSFTLSSSNPTNAPDTGSVSTKPPQILNEQSATTTTTTTTNQPGKSTPSTNGFQTSITNPGSSPATESLPVVITTPPPPPTTIPIPIHPGATITTAIGTGQSSLTILQLSSTSAAVVNGATLSVGGEAITVNGVILTYASTGLVIVSTPSPTPPPTITSLGGIIMSIFTYSELPSGSGVVVGTQTLTPGGTISYSGTVYALLSTGTVPVVVSTYSSSAAATETSSGGVPFTGGASKETANFLAGLIVWGVWFLVVGL